MFYLKHTIDLLRHMESQALIDDASFADSVDEIETENLELERVGL